MGVFSVVAVQSVHWSASAHGYRVVWVNRQGQAPERLPGQPDHVVRDLSALPRLLGLDT